jgi:hypothetical protein
MPTHGILLALRERVPAAHAIRQNYGHLQWEPRPHLARSELISDADKEAIAVSNGEPLTAGQQLLHALHEGPAIADTGKLATLGAHFAEPVLRRDPDARP